MPLDIDLSPIIYRKDLVAPVLSKLGMKEFPKDWDSFLKLLDQLTVDQNGDGIIDQWGLVMEHGTYYLQSVFLVQRNGRFFSEDYKQVLVNSPAVVEAVSDYAALFRSKKALLYTGTEGTGSIAGLLKSGQAVMYIQGPWYRSELELNCPELKGKWAFAPMPVKYPGAPSTALTGICMAVPYNAKNVAEAADFIKYFTGDVAAQTAYFKQVGSPSPLLSLLDGSFYQLKLDYFGDELIYPALMEGVKNGVAIETFPKQEMSERILMALDEVCFNGKDPKAAMDEAQREIEQMLP